MSISLTPEQERFVETKLQGGRYGSVEEILEAALRLLDKYETSSAEWIEEVLVKIDAALAASNQTAPIDGEMFVNGILERFQPKS